jgi:hypothetical protein
MNCIGPLMNPTLFIKNTRIHHSRVAYPHNFNADQDPAFHHNANTDQDPAFHLIADPDLAPFGAYTCVRPRPSTALF